MRLCRLLLVLSVLASVGVIVLFALRLPVLAFLVGIFILSRRRKPMQLSAHGTARFADADDLRQAGMLGDEGLAIGRLTLGRPSFKSALKWLFDWKVPSRWACERFVTSLRNLRELAVARLAKAVHVMCVAPVGAGKSTTLVVPFLLETEHSCVVLDPKGELARITADARRAMGHKVVLLDPFRVVTDTPDTFNPMACINWDSPLALDECRASAKEIVVRSGEERDPHFNDRAEQVIAAMASFLATVEPGLRSLQSVRDLITNEALRDEAIEKMMASDLWGRMLRRAGQSVAGLQSEEKASVYSTCHRHTSFLDTVPVAESTRRSSFDPAELKAGKMTVYLVMPVEHMRAQAALMRLWVGSLLRACLKAGLGEEKKVFFVLDEAASLGRLDVLEDALAYMRGWGVRLMLFYQSLGQLKKCWQEGAEHTTLANTSQIYFGVRDLVTAEQVSKAAGEQTILTEHWGTNTGGSTSANTHTAGGSIGRSWGGNTGYQQTGRPILKPEEVMTLPQQVAITFTPGVPPVLTRLVPYYAKQAAPTRWQRFRATAALWFASISLLALTSTVGAWLTAVLTPVRR